MSHFDSLRFARAHEPNPNAVIGGTLCLMSCSMMSGTHLYLNKIIDNFNYLADCEIVDRPLRVLCRRMAAHWEAERMKNEKRAQGEQSERNERAGDLAQSCEHASASSGPDVITHLTGMGFDVNSIDTTNDSTLPDDVPQTADDHQRTAQAWQEMDTLIKKLRCT
jgi:hypothetical protein